MPPPTLVYSSLAADRQPVFIDHYILDATQSAAPNWVSAQLVIKDTAGVTTIFTGQTYYYNTSLDNPGDVMEIALQATGLSSLATRRYLYQINITANYATQQTRTDQGNFNLVNSPADIASIFGNGWSLAGLQRLVPLGMHRAQGALLDLGAGQGLWFAPNGSGGFIDPAGDFTKTLTYNSGSNTYTRLLPDGTSYTFDGNGREISVADRNANTYTFSYDGNGRLLWIEDFNLQYVTFGYNANHEVNGIVDPATRTTVLDYDASNRLNSITDPAPGFGESTPVLNFNYDTGVDHILTLTDLNSHVSTFTYNAEGRVSSVARPDNKSVTLTALQMAGLISVGYGTSPSNAVTATLAVEAQAQYTDANTNQWNTRLDWLGFGRMTQATDPLDNQAVTHRDANGLPWLVADQLGRRTRTFFDSTTGHPTTVALADENYQYY